ncbi:MAG: hypothetical protein ABIO86_01910 [Sphingomonas sp.]
MLTSYADLDAWVSGFGDGHLAASPEQTRALLIGLCRIFAEKLDLAQLRCLELAGRSDELDARDKADRELISRRIAQETPRLVPDARLSTIVHLPPDQARNRLVFAACVAEDGPLDWSLAEYLPLWAEDAEIPIDQCLAVFRAHVPELGF